MWIDVKIRVAKFGPKIARRSLNVLFSKEPKDYANALQKLQPRPFKNSHNTSTLFLDE